MQKTKLFYILVLAITTIFSPVYSGEIKSIRASIEYPYRLKNHLVYEKRLSRSGETSLETIYNDIGKVIYQATFTADSKPLSIGISPSTKLSLFHRGKAKEYLQLDRQKTFTYYLYRKRKVIEKIYYPDLQTRHITYHYFSRKGTELEAVTLGTNKKTRERIVKTYDKRKKLIGESVYDLTGKKVINYKRAYLYSPDNNQIFQELEYDKWERIFRYITYAYEYNSDDKLRRKTIYDILNQRKVIVTYSYKDQMLSGTKTNVYDKARLVEQEIKTFALGRPVKTKYYVRGKLKYIYKFYYEYFGEEQGL
ncbi:MAG: hypothetical protein AAF518_03150 [Spirochaetota bacterium]